MSFCIVYLASPRSFRVDPSNEPRIDLLEKSVEIAHRIFPTTDILVFHEDYTYEEFNRLPGVKQFIQVSFAGLEHLRAPGLRRPYGYLMMCRFFSGVVQSNPILQRYTHYMRLDDDSYFTEPYLTEDKVKSLLTHDYVFRSVFQDTQDQQSLFDFTLRFLSQHGYGQHIPKLRTELQKRYMMNPNGTYTGLAPYNNFHIASVRLWNHPLIQKYIQAIEESAGILKYGWMDANIHGMIIFVVCLFLDLDIHHESSFGYRHNRHVSRPNSSAVHYDESLPFGV